MNQKTKNPIFLKNYMEEAVFHAIDDLSKKYEFCTCNKCRMDMAAYALNCLPPKYVVTQKGEVYSKMSYLQQQFEVDVTIALMKAIKIVANNPQHDTEGILNG